MNSNLSVQQVFLSYCNANKKSENLIPALFIVFHFQFPDADGHLVYLPLHTALISDSQMISRLWRGVEIPLELEKIHQTEHWTVHPLFPLWAESPGCHHPKSPGLQCKQGTASPDITWSIPLSTYSFFYPLHSIFSQSKLGPEITRLRTPSPFYVATKFKLLLEF